MCHAESSQQLGKWLNGSTSWFRGKVSNFLGYDALGDFFPSQPGQQETASGNLGCTRAFHGMDSEFRDVLRYGMAPNPECGSRHCRQGP